MFYKITLTLSLLLVPINAFAQASSSDILLMESAVRHSSQADAYNIYCDKESDLAGGFIEQLYENRDLSNEQWKSLLAIKAEILDLTSASLKEKGQDCKALEFMMPRLEVMQKLKDVSYLLNGINPKTLPAPNAPNIEDLLPNPNL